MSEHEHVWKPTRSKGPHPFVCAAVGCNAMMHEAMAIAMLNEHAALKRENSAREDFIADVLNDDPAWENSKTYKRMIALLEASHE